MKTYHTTLLDFSIMCGVHQRKDDDMFSKSWIVCLVAWPDKTPCLHCHPRTALGGVPFFARAAAFVTATEAQFEKLTHDLRSSLIFVSSSEAKGRL